jgi:hypothetical protein
MEPHTWGIHEAFVDTIDGSRYAVEVNEERRFYHMMQLHYLQDIDMKTEPSLIYTILDIDSENTITPGHPSHPKNLEILPDVTRNTVGYLDPVSLAREVIAYNNGDLESLLKPETPHPKGVWEGADFTIDEDYYNDMVQDYYK